jgi:amidophosphoribosyltransferase
MTDTSLFADSLHEECGIFGIAGPTHAATHVALGLHALQHRGQEAAGIVSCDQGIFHVHTAKGHVGDHFNSPQVIDTLKGNHAIGHVRYPTAGGSAIRNTQPVYAELSFGGIAIAHNGNLTNALTLRKSLISRGCIFQSTMDTELVIHLIAISTKQDLLDRFVDALHQIEGAYSLIALTKDMIIAVRDPYGIRPMVLGQLDGQYVIASETCAFDIIGARFVRDIAAGEMVTITDGKVQSYNPFAKVAQRFCIFEYVYFARPDSVVDGRHVYSVRKQIGAELASESPTVADIVVPVPDSGVPAALGYAAAANLPFELGIIRNHYVGRTFIEPSDHVRHLGVKLKHNANATVLAGKRVVLVDDSIVRGTTSKKIVQMVREAGAKEVHMRISSPPTTHSCFYGVDTPSREGLIAARQSVAEMASFIGVDSLAFISIDGLYRALGEARRQGDLPQFCDACFTGEYPITVKDAS